MTTIRESIRRLFLGDKGQEPSASDFAYVIHWTNLARTWDHERRIMLYAEVSSIIDSPDFTPNAMERRYHVDKLDDLPHAGASLLALKQVLEALQFNPSE
jgi:hypothetical protein